MFSYLLLGVLQGVFEWIPVSSEGIVSLVSYFWAGFEEPVDLALFLHLGTMLAVLLYFRKEWREVFLLKDRKRVRFLVVSTVVSLMVGFPLYGVVREVAVGRALLVVTGAALLLTSYFQKKKFRIRVKGDLLAALAGFLQGLAVIPGLSRSGSTIFGLSLGGMEPEQNLKTSYMISVPVVLASSGYLFLKDPGLLWAGWPALVTSFAAGFLSLRLLLRWAKKVNFFRFAFLFSLLCFLGALLY